MKKGVGKVESVEHDDGNSLKADASTESSLQQLKRVKREEQDRRLSQRLEQGKAQESKEKRCRIFQPTVSSGLSCPTGYGSLLCTGQFDNFILDCDGVMWHGEAPIQGSIEACRRLQNAGCKIHFVTNSSAATREQIVQKFRRLGLTNVSIQEVTTSGSAAARLIRSKYPDIKCAYVVGESGLIEELQLSGLQTVGGPPDDQLFARNSGEFQALNVDPAVDIVVCGLDRNFSYGKLARASLHLQKGLRLVCTNNDLFDVLPPKGNVPGAGCIAAAIKASYPQVNEIVAGKPSGELLLEIMRYRGMAKSRTIMIGDRVDTDIEFAENAGIASCLVLTGVSSLPEHMQRATYCQSSLWHFVDAVLPEEKDKSENEDEGKLKYS